MNTKGIFSHKSDLWKTPKKLYEVYMNDGFFDPCPENPTFDGLQIEWKEKNFVNPPYSQIAKWIDKGLEEALKGRYSVFLVPARTDTKWFHKAIYEYKCYPVFIRGRLKFNDGKNSAPFPSMLIAMGYEKQIEEIQEETENEYQADGN